MKKNNNKLLIAIIVLVAGLFVCVSINIYKIINNGNKNVVEIDDKSNQDKTTEKKEDKKDDNNKTNNNSNTNNSGGTSGTSGGNGTGSGSGGSGSSGTGESGNGSGSGTGTGPSSGTTPSEEPANNVVVSDNEKTWEQNTSLKIFNVDEIKPGDSGKYEFSIYNKTDGNIVYSIDFSEENKYSVNLLYKLKMNGKYIAGDSDKWVNSDELDLNKKVLDSKYMDKLYLEWKWVDSDHDTIAGTTPGAKYKLQVNVSSKETSEHDTSGGGSINPYTGDKIVFYIEMCLGAAIGMLIIILLKRKKNENSKCD